MAEGMSESDRVDLVEAPAEDELTPVSGVFNFFMGKTSYNTRRPLRVSFIHDYDAQESGWVLAHEIGRQHLEELFGGIVATVAHEGCAKEDAFTAAVEASVQWRADVVFSTSPALMDFTVKAALAYPGIRFLNCSVGLPHPVVHSYYGKMYEAKFVLGALAASVAEGHRIGYRSYYPVFGTIAEINAFAIGASLVDPAARVILSWSRDDPRDLASVMHEQGVQVMSGSDVVAPYAPADSYGLHRLEGDELVNIGAPKWRWGRYYELIVRSLLHGSWEESRGENGGRAVSYWYGMGAGVIDVRVARDLPYASKKLTRLLRRCVIGDSIHPFEDELWSQERMVQLAGFPALSSLEVVGMTWLADNVEGGFPDDWDFDGRTLVSARSAGGSLR